VFSHDYADGTLEQLMLVPQPLSIVVLGKIIAHWLVTGAPLILIAPILGVQFDLPSGALLTLLISLLLGTPALSLIGATGAALTLGLRGGSVLVSLLILPLCIPVLIFGAGAVEASITGASAESHLSLLGALLVLTLLFTPWATAAALRISME
jgi:heme exporter protein B